MFGSTNLAVLVIATGAASFVLASGLWVFLARRAQNLKRRLAPAPQTVFLFDGQTLLDATPQAMSLLHAGSTDTPTLASTLRLLAGEFPTLEAEIETAQSEHLRVRSTIVQGSSVAVDTWDGKTRLVVESPDTPGAPHPIAMSAMQNELETLRALAEISPQLIWKEAADGQISWANRSYLAVSDAVLDRSPYDAPQWPPLRIFKDLEPLALGDTDSSRASIHLPSSGSEHWYDVDRTCRAGETICFAVDANAIVHAENQSLEFVQTLTKTFADLSIGLAIFDRQRRMVMFNPALLDLTGLPVPFLSSRPTFAAVLDQLREAQMIPEPRDYKSWRDRVTTLETEATRGTFKEDWALTTGQTYRVTGRPHPDGALAILIEDITAEISLTRSFRAELATSQSVLDALEDAMAVFSSTGALLMTNSAYQARWSTPDNALDATLTTELEIWRKRAAPTPMWDRLITMVQRLSDRSPLREPVLLRNGQTLMMKADPLHGGATLVSFAAVGGQTERPDIFVSNRSSA